VPPGARGSFRGELGDGRERFCRAVRPDQFGALGRQATQVVEREEDGFDALLSLPGAPGRDEPRQGAGEREARASLADAVEARRAARLLSDS